MLVAVVVEHQFYRIAVIVHVVLVKGLSVVLKVEVVVSVVEVVVNVELVENVVEAVESVEAVVNRHQTIKQLGETNHLKAN